METGSWILVNRVVIGRCESGIHRWLEHPFCAGNSLNWLWTSAGHTGNDIINGNVYNLMNNGDIRNKSAVYYKDAWFANNPTGSFTGPGAIDWSGYMWVVFQL